MLRFKWYYAGLIILPLFANCLSLSGFVKCDPELYFSGLGTAVTPGYLPGATCFVDPAVAYITQPLGQLSAHDWLHGIIPWWNPFSGAGMPLAAEMQTESFFLPFVLLLHFHAGWLLQRLMFQMLSGLFTFLLLLDLGLMAPAAWLGGALFALNGAFILTAGMVSGPIFALPMLLLGIEQARRATSTGQRMGWSLIAAALIASIYAGFPELAYLDGLLGAVWAAFRLVQEKKFRFKFFLKLVSGGLVGLAITLPLSVPFFQYLQLGYVAAHYGVLAHTVLRNGAAPLQMLPLFYGAIAASTPATLTSALGGTWVQIGGWFGCAPVLLALYGLLPNGRPKSARYVLAGWVLLWELRYFGAPGIAALVNLVPGIAASDSVRYSTVTVMFAVFLLAAFGFEDLLRGIRLSRYQIFGVIALFSISLILSVAPALKSLGPWYAAYPKLEALSAFYMACSFVTMATVLGAIISGRGKIFSGALIVSGAVGIFLIPQLAASRTGQIAVQDIATLQAKNNFNRFYTVAPFAPNYPASYDLASINYLQLPAPQNWADYIHKNLFATADVSAFGGGQAGQMDALLQNLPNYAAAGVDYILMYPGTEPFTHRLTVTPGPNGYSVLNAIQSLSGTLNEPDWPTTSIGSVSIVVGTYQGYSTGILVARLCSVGACSTGQVQLNGVPDNKPLTIILDKPLTIASGEDFKYQFTHTLGLQVAIFVTPASGASQFSGPGKFSPSVAPQLVFNQTVTGPKPVRIFRGETVDIYKIANSAAYAQTADAGCELTMQTRQSMSTNCAKPSTLLRRELFYPGWHAQVNGKEVAIVKSGAIFQSINLPAGLARISFYYIPDYTRLSCAAALLAILFWLAAAFSARRRSES